MAATRLTPLLLLTGMVCVSLLAGCASAADDEDSGGFSLPKLADLNPFNIAKTPLPGKRVAVLTSEDQVTSHMEQATGSIVIPPAYQTSEWATPGGTASNAPGHLALPGQLRTVWTQSAGTASSAAARIVSPPIVHQGRVYVQDAANQVSAFAEAGGAKVWSVSTAPEGSTANKAFGGGIAAEGARVFVATGFGTVVALNAGTGVKLWERKIGAPIHSAPTVADGRVFATNTDGQVVCLAVADGGVLWTFNGSPQQSAAVLSNTRPAVAGDQVIIPFTSGELVALKVDSGQPVWTENVNGAKATSTAAGLSDPASPVANGGFVYAASRSGRMIATNSDTGSRAWSMNVGGIEMPWVAGDAVYVVDTTGRLVALKRTTGETRWAMKLPGTAKVWSGPVLAGGRLWLTSSKGGLAGVDPSTGQVTAQRELGEPIFISPVVADGRMYVLTDKANLMALE